eukprot:TRINITY_DN9872_c0_g1_i1.p1 TRINITY_DN9872_c0_g1~~TRINITY_DN9872_c0_g1_i1.p1  ORF type:complete len:129 (-),score=23.33 TRINITY_DN9872_c0_g1_i1:22-408(-)
MKYLFAIVALLFTVAFAAETERPNICNSCYSEVSLLKCINLDAFDGTLIAVETCKDDEICYYDRCIKMDELEKLEEDSGEETSKRSIGSYRYRYGYYYGSPYGYTPYSPYYYGRPYGYRYSYRYGYHY